MNIDMGLNERQIIAKYFLQMCKNMLNAMYLTGWMLFSSCCLDTFFKRGKAVENIANTGFSQELLFLTHHTLCQQTSQLGHFSTDGIA